MTMQDDTQKQIELYTDGAAEPNPGPAGYGVVLKCGQHYKELSEGFEISTNNRMELLAVIVGLEALKGKRTVTVYSDSKYVVEAVNLGWIYKWRDKDWHRNRINGVKNIDLWERFLEVYEKHDTTFVWVKGHAGIPDNERCDCLAVEASKSINRQIDAGYAPTERKTTPNSSSEKHSKIKHKKEGEPCRKCGTPIIKRNSRQKNKAKKKYCFEWYLYCPNCKAMYMVEEAKIFNQTAEPEKLTTLFGEKDNSD